MIASYSRHEQYGVEGAAETRPGSSVQMFDYIFYADIQASMADTRLQNALRHLKVCTRLLCTVP